MNAILRTIPSHRLTQAPAILLSVILGLPATKIEAAVRHSVRADRSADSAQLRPGARPARCSELSSRQDLG